MNGWITEHYGLLQMLHHKWENYTDEERQIVRAVCAERGHDYSVQVWDTTMWVCFRCGEPGWMMPV